MPRCGTGATRTSPLILKKSDLPQGTGLIQTGHGETLASRDIADSLVAEIVSGLELREARAWRSGDRLQWVELASSYQMPPMSKATTEAHAKTRARRVVATVISTAPRRRSRLLTWATRLVPTRSLTSSTPGNASGTRGWRLRMIATSQGRGSHNRSSSSSRRWLSSSPTSGSADSLSIPCGSSASRPSCRTAEATRGTRFGRRDTFLNAWSGIRDYRPVTHVDYANESLPRDEPLRVGNGLDPLADLLR
jgi:hypothetical protein